MMRLSGGLKEAALEAARSMQSRNEKEASFEYAKAHYKIRQGLALDGERFLGRFREDGLTEYGIFLLPNGAH